MSEAAIPPTIVVIAYRARPEGVDTAVSELTDLIATVVALEPDCFAIRLLRDPADPARILLVEEWTSREAYLGPHLETPHLLAFKVKAGDLFEGPPERSFWRLESEFSQARSA